MKLEELKPGDVVVVDENFTCMTPGEKTVKQTVKGELYVWCRDENDDLQKHMLDGQVGDDGHLIGVSWPSDKKEG